MAGNALVEEVYWLQSLYERTSCFLKVHRCASTGNISSCCAASRAVLQSVASANSTSGVSGIFSYLQSKYSWGIRRCEYLCDAVEHANEADCGARAQVAMELIQAHLSQYHSASCICPRGDCLCVAHVELILRQDELDVTLFKNDLDKMYAHCSTPTQLAYLKGWLGNSCCYHRCVGLYSTGQRYLRVWDFGEWLTYSSSRSMQPGSVLAIRVTPLPLAHDCATQDSNGIANGCFTSACVEQDTATCGISEWFLWDGEAKLRGGVWEPIGICTLSDGGDDRGHTIQGTQQQSTSTQPLTVPSHVDILASIYATGTCSVTSTPPPVHSLRDRSIGNTSIKAGAPPMVTVEVYISGCHMSENPGAGVGIARALRSAKNLRVAYPYVPSTATDAWEGTTAPSSRDTHVPPYGPGAEGSGERFVSLTTPSLLKLVAVDDIDTDIFSGVTDPVFDICRSIILYNSFDETASLDIFNTPDMVSCSGENELFCEAIVKMLCPRSNEDGVIAPDATCRYFIPVSWRCREMMSHCLCRHVCVVCCFVI